jgi:hypothetical protein
MNMNNIRTITAKAASEEDLCVALAYVQDALEVTHRLKDKLERMPIAIRAMLDDRGEDLNIGARAEFMFLQSINYIEQLIDCL